MNSLMWTAGARTRTLVVAGMAAVVVVIAAAALLVAQGAAGTRRTPAYVRATRDLAQLVAIGADLRGLTASGVASAQLSAAGEHALDDACGGAGSRVCSTISLVWNRSGRIVYSSVEATEGTRPAVDAALAAALSGRAVTRISPHDSTRGRDSPPACSRARAAARRARGGLRCDGGRASLKPIDAAAATSLGRNLLFVVGGAALGGTLLLPLWTRLARSRFRDRVSGRRRTVRAVRERSTAVRSSSSSSRRSTRRAAGFTASRLSSAGAATESWSRRTSSCRPSSPAP